jgi:DnaJ like chaperone protein
MADNESQIVEQPARPVVQAWFEDDDVGRLVRIGLSHSFSASWALVARLLDVDGRPVKAEPELASSTGDFFIAEPLSQNDIQFFVPFGFLRHYRPGLHLLRIDIVDTANSMWQEHAGTLLQFELPAPRPASRAEVYLPLLVLAFQFTLVDGPANLKELQFVKSVHEALNLTKMEVVDSLTAHIASGQYDGDSTRLVQTILRRCPRFRGTALLTLLVEMAKVDGPVTPEETALIRSVAEELGYTDERWPVLAQELGLDSWDPFQVLGLCPGASAENVRLAYRELIKQYHPDRVVNLAQEFQDLAHRKSIELRKAYEFLLKRAGS